MNSKTRELPMNRSLGTALLVGALSLVASCSLSLDWSECDESRPCPNGGACNLGVCADPVASDDTAPQVSDDGIVDVSGVISADTTWTADTIWRLNGIVYIDPNVTLTIEPGTTIHGNSGAVLAVERGGFVDARGTAGSPIVFTSAKPPGQRSAGDWGGILMLGDATIESGTDQPFEIAADGSRGRFGGTEDDSSCGTLQYVRIEYAGISGDGVDEISALELAACGTNTVIDYVQVHRALDEAVDILGGSVRLRHLFITLPGVTGIEWAEGWHGNAQFIAIHLGNTGLIGFEVDEALLGPNEKPEIRPEIFNVSILSSGSLAGQVGIELSAGARGHMHNMIIAGPSFHAVEVKDVETSANLEAFLIEIAYSMFWSIGEGGDSYFPSVEEETAIEAFDGRDDDGGFDEDHHFREVMEDNVFGIDPEISNMTSETNCGWVPQADLPNIALNPHTGQGFVEGARFLGAFQKNLAPWHEGWTTSSLD